MVQKGKFSVELIDVATKNPFKEHHASAEPEDVHCVDKFIEIEPGSEYFVRVSNDSSSTIICNISVDGNDLGYEFCLGPYEYDDKGVWKLEGGTSQHIALKVHKVMASAINESNNSNSDIGVVCVDFFEYIECEGTEMANEFQSNWNSDKSSTKKNPEEDSKKQVKSQVGSHSEIISRDDGTRNVYNYGDSLETIRVKYCTTVGLIGEGCLQKPPLWEWARLTHPKENNINTENIPTIEPIIKRFHTKDEEGNIVEKKEVEMFDLTGLDE